MEWYLNKNSSEFIPSPSPHSLEIKIWILSLKELNYKKLLLYKFMKTTHMILRMAAKNFTPTQFLSHLQIYIYTHTFFFESKVHVVQKKKCLYLQHSNTFKYFKAFIINPSKPMCSILAILCICLKQMQLMPIPKGVIDRGCR